MSEDEILSIVIKVLESIVKKTEGSGRHELNLSDVKATIGELKVMGLPA